MARQHELAELLFSRDASLVGFADLQEIPPASRQGLPMAVSIAVAIDPYIIAGLKVGPTSIYHDEYHRVNNLLNSLARSAVEYLHERNCKAIALSADDVGYNTETLGTPLPHKTAATRAGLGWIGRSSLLVTEEYGTAVRLTTVLTDADLPAGTPINESHCGECFACMHACPASAPTGRQWHAGDPREAIVDAFACSRTAGSHAAKAGFDDIICGLCISICPYTRRYIERCVD